MRERACFTMSTLTFWPIRVCVHCTHRIQAYLVQPNCHFWLNSKTPTMTVGSIEFWLNVLVRVCYDAYRLAFMIELLFSLTMNFYLWNYSKGNSVLVCICNDRTKMLSTFDNDYTFIHLGIAFSAIITIKCACSMQKSKKIKTKIERISIWRLWWWWSPHVQCLPRD